MSKVTLFSVGASERTISPLRVGSWRAVIFGGLLGTCALAVAPMQAAAVARVDGAPSLAAEQSLLLSSGNEEPTGITTKVAPAPSEELQPVGQPTDYHVDRFKADIERLRSERWAAAPATTVAETLESEPQAAWHSLVSPATVPASVIFPWLTLRGFEAAQVASSSLDTGSGLDIFQAPVGKLVVPQLPPLDAPDAYLPESPDRFNGYIWPAAGTITSGYGYRWGRLHRGIDIAGPVGTPILAASSGEVIGAGWSGGYGKLVKLKHRDGSVTYYAHNSRILVSKGQQVRQGQQIATLGNTGRSTGPHLHFEIHTGKGSVNPLALLPKKR